MGAIDVIRGRQTATRTLTNKSGGAVAVGDIVYIGDGTNDNSFTTGTTAAFNTRMVGVAMEAIANDAAGLVALHGYVSKVNSAAGLTRGHFLFTSSVAKEATGSATRAAGAFGQVLESATDPEAIIWGMPDPTAGTTDLAGKELDYVETTSNTSVTATSEGTANTVVTGNSVAYDGSTIILVEFSAYAMRADINAAARTLTLVLTDGGTALGWLGEIDTSVSASVIAPVRVSRRLTPTAASHTYDVRAYVNAGTGVVYAGAGGSGAAMPAYLRITRVTS